MATITRQPAVTLPVPRADSEQLIPADTQAPVPVAAGWIPTILFLAMVFESLGQLTLSLGDLVETVVIWVVAAVLAVMAATIMVQRWRCGRRMWPWMAVMLAVMLASPVLASIGIDLLHQALDQIPAVSLHLSS